MFGHVTVTYRPTDMVAFHPVNETMAVIETDPAFLRRQLRGRGLAAARLAWLLVVVPTLALAVFGFAVAFADLTLLVPESVFVALGPAGIDPAVAVVVGLVLPLVLMSVTAGVMFWNRPADPMVLLTSLMLITFQTTASRSTFAAVSTVPELEGIVRAVLSIGFGSFVLVFAVFPNGRSVPAWAAWMAAPVLATIWLVLPELPRVLAMFPDRPPDFDEVTWAFNLTVLIVAVWGFGVICQVYRYQRVSTGRCQRRRNPPGAGRSAGGGPRLRHHPKTEMPIIETQRERRHRPGGATSATLVMMSERPSAR